MIIGQREREKEKYKGKQLKGGIVNIGIGYIK